MYKTINVRNEQGVELEGFMFEVNTKTCVLHIPGFGGAFDSLPQIMGEYFQKNHIAYLCGLTQGAYPQKTLKKFKADNTFTEQLCGATYEKFENSLPDISCWVEYLLKNGYDNLFLLGHSLGCNKVLYYLKEKNIKQIKGVILLAPQDFSKIVYNPIHQGMLEEAEDNIKRGEPHKILNRRFLGFAPISSFTFYNMKDNKNQHNFNYKDPNENYQFLKDINKQVFMVMGNKDPAVEKMATEEIDSCFSRVHKCFNRFSYKIIKNAGHTFNGKEELVAKYVLNYITEGNYE